MEDKLDDEFLDKKAEIFKLNDKNKKNIIRIKFANKLLQLSKLLLDEKQLYKVLYNEFLTTWKSISIYNTNRKLYRLLEFLCQDNIYNIKNTIIGIVTDTNLDDILFLRFVNDFISL